jgi:hypothetical protein
MRKHQFYGQWHRYRLLSLLVIIFGLIISGAASVYALRNNNLKMAQLRQAVYAVDANDGDVATALNDLRQFIYTHMNTKLRNGSSSEPPIQLVDSFNRMVSAEQARLTAINASANQVYVDAQKQCEVAGVPLTVRAQCMQDYVSANGHGIPQLNLPDKSFYTFDFVSPTWSPDLAGWSIIVAIIFGLLLIVRLATGYFIGRYLRE